MPGVKYLTLFLACLAVFTAGTNASIIDGGTSYYTTTPSAHIFYDDSDEIAEIQCNVYTYDSGVFEDKYAYTYRIHNTSDKDLDFISMQILNVVDVAAYGFEVSYPDVIPGIWSPVGSPEHSISAHFNDTILDGEQSALLWFVSDYAPTEAGEGFLIGTYTPPGQSVRLPIYAEGPLIAPTTVPEPATFLLISMGTFAIIGRRRRNKTV